IKEFLVEFRRLSFVYFLNGKVYSDVKVMNFIVAHFQEVHQVMIVLKEAFALQLQNIPGFSSGELVEVSFSFYLIKRESCLVLYFFFFTGISAGDFVTFFDRILGNEF